MKKQENNKQKVKQKITPKMLKNIGREGLDSFREILF